MALKQAISACHALPAVAGVLPGIKKERVGLWSDLLHKCSAWSLNRRNIRKNLSRSESSFKSFAFAKDLTCKKFKRFRPF